MKKFIFFYSFILWCFVAKSQCDLEKNLVPNGGFEDQSSCPTVGTGSMPWVDNWDNISNHDGSPDYYHKCVSKNAPDPKQDVPDNSEGSQDAKDKKKAYAGIIARSVGSIFGWNAGEYINVALSEPLVAGKFYEAIMYVSLSDNSDYALAGLSMLFTTFKPSGDGTHALLTGFNPQIVSVSVISDKNGWTKISGVFQASGGESWLTIGVFDKILSDPVFLDNGFFDFAYYYIDQVSITLDYCNNFCSPDFSSIIHSTIPTGMCGNSNMTCSPCDGNTCVFPACCQTFRVLIENATGIEFIMFDTWGGEFYHYDSFDNNGLKNSGYSDFLLEWNGNNDQGNNVPEDVYVIYLRIWNCNKEIIIIQSLTVFPPAEDAFVIPEIHNCDLENCCEDFKYYQNIDLTGTFRKDVNDFIIAGENVTSGTTGPVIVKSGADVKFVAGNFIDLAPGFSVEPGATFERRIAECGAPGKTGPISRWSEYDIFNQEETETTNEEDSTINRPGENYFTIHPNPSTGRFQLTMAGGSSSQAELFIYNILGEIIYQSKITKPQSEINISSHPKGIYFVKVISGDEVFVDKIISQ